MLRTHALGLLCALVWLSAAAPARAGWTRPVDGPVVAGFDYTRARAFAAGARRGADLAAAPGVPVRAPCSGRVRFAGAVPGWGAGVSVRCGALVATVLRLGAVGVRRGAFVLAGRRVASAGGAGRVRLGARRAGDRFGYLDPVALLGEPGRAPPPTLGPAPRTGERPPTAAPRRWRAPRESAAPRGAPLVAWLGLALAAFALTAGGSGRMVRRRRRVAAVRRGLPAAR